MGKEGREEKKGGKRRKIKQRKEGQKKRGKKITPTIQTFKSDFSATNLWIIILPALHSPQLCHGTSLNSAAGREAKGKERESFAHKY